MSEIWREYTVKEESEIGDIDDTGKQRILSKLKRDDCVRAEYEAKLAKERECFYAQLLPLKEAYSSLVYACEALAKAMITERKVLSNEI